MADTCQQAESFLNDVFASAGSTFQAQRYIPSQDQWVDASTLDPTNPPSPLSSKNEGSELGPAFLQRLVLWGVASALLGFTFWPLIASGTEGPITRTLRERYQQLTRDESQ